VEIRGSVGLVYFLFLHCTSNYTLCHGPYITPDPTYMYPAYSATFNSPSHTNRPVLPPALCLACLLDPSTLAAKSTTSLQNVVKHLHGNTVSHPRKPEGSRELLWKPEISYKCACSQQLLQPQMLNFIHINSTMETNTLHSCLCLCFIMSHFCVNARPHFSQINGFSPVCIRT
jgi:hypothetical protein